MLLDERLICYGRGTTGNGYAGALGTPTVASVGTIAKSAAPGGIGFTGNANVFVIVAADAGDLLGTNGTTMHQGPSSTVSTAASVAVTTGNAVQVNISSDVSGALGYNIYCASVVGGPYYYSGRTGYTTGYINSQPTSGPTTTSGAADGSAVATNFDGLLTNVAASGGYSTRLNAAFSTTNPGAEFQTCFASLYESVKADPEQTWLNGFDRAQISNSIVNNAANTAYRIYIASGAGQGGVSAGVVVQSLVNETTGSNVDVMVHPWFPQGNALVRSVTLPIPDSNVSETSGMAMVQDYVAIQWPVVQMTYDASTFEIGTLANYAPAWSGIDRKSTRLNSSHLGI